MPGAPIRELSGKVLGIVGFGNSARPWPRPRAAHWACACWWRSVPVRRTARDADTNTSIGPVRVTLDELLRNADVLSLHCPLTPATTGMIGKHELAMMKPDALLINTARGALVDLEALVEALRGGDLGGAAIDVLPQEPPVDGSPLFAPGHSESHRHAAYRLGGIRGAAARRGRAGAQYRGFPARRSSRPRGVTTH